MTAKFDAFKAALQALCVEHGVRLHDDGDYDYRSVHLSEASAQEPAGVDLTIYDDVPMTAEERAVEDARHAAFWADHRERQAAYRAEQEAHYGTLIKSENYIGLQAAIEAHSKEQRKKQMRASTDPTDPSYIDDRPRKVWLNDVEVADWITADEFRRCVVTVAGAAHGAVMIERLQELGAPEVEPGPECSTSLSGVFVKVPDEPVAEVAPESMGVDFGDQSAPGDPSASNSAAPTQSHKKKHKRGR